MSTEKNTQNANSNSGNNQNRSNSSSLGYKVINESAVHKPVPGKGGNSGNGGKKK